MENDLGRRVRERTAEPARANNDLQAEIGHRTRAMEELQESEARYRSLFENSNGDFRRPSPRSLG